MRGAVGDAAGLTVKAQLRQAAQHLGYPPEDWRVREAWYGRAGSWSAAALDDLRRRHAAWRDREAAVWSGLDGDHSRPALALRLRTIGAALADLQRKLDALSADIGKPSEGGSSHDG